MAKKQKTLLIHKSFGEVAIKSSFFTASSNSKFFTALCPDGKTRNLLSESEYWISDAAEVTKQFNAYSAKQLLIEKEKRAAERKKEIYAAKNLSPDKRVRAIFKSDEVEEIECGTGIDDAEKEHKSDEQAHAAGEW